MEDDLDDLFGEGAPLQMSTPITPTLIARLNESAATGCCQQVAWSRHGAIASLTADKRGVALQHLTCDPQSGQWRLSKAYIVDDVAAAHGDVDLVHLSWDHNGNFLAVCDIEGRISIYILPTLNLVINRLMAFRRGGLDPKDDLSAVAGLAWLPEDQLKSFNARPAVQKDGRWTYTMVQLPVSGPKSILQKPALLVTTRSGRVRMLSAEKDRWIETSAELEAFGRQTASVTHAAFYVDKASGPDCMLLVVHNSLGEIRLYQLKIESNPTALTIRRVALLRGLIVQSPTDEQRIEVPSGHSALTSLQLVPAKIDPKAPSLPKIIAVTTRISYDFQGSDTAETVIHSLQITADDAVTHAAFNALGPNPASSKNPGSSKSLRIVKSAEVSVSKALLMMQYALTSNTLTVGWHDGTVELRNTQSLNCLPPDGSSQISGLMTNGFSFPIHGSPISMTLSPNAYAMYTLGDAYGSDVAFLQYIGSTTRANPPDEASMSIISEAFAVQLSLAIRSLNTDDLLGTIQLFVNQYLGQIQLDFMPSTLTTASDFQRYLIAGYLRHLQSERLIVDNPEQLVSGPTFRTCITFQSILGYQGRDILRSTESTVAVVLLNLRFVSQAISAAVKNQNGENELKRPDTAVFFLPLATWFLTLICHLTDELITSRNEFERSGVSPEHIDANVINQQIQQARSIALPLMFGAASRLLLTHTCRAVRTLQIEADKHVNARNTGSVFREFEIQSRKFPVNVHQFERIVAQVDASVKSTYQAPGIGDSEKKAAELQVFIRGEIPPLLTRAVSRLLFQHLSLFREDINEADLYFCDFSSLALTPDAYTRKRNQENPLDVITKLKLKKGSAMRQCTRCGSLTEDVAQSKVINTKSRLTKMCVCGSYWIQLDPEDRNFLQL